MNGKNYRDGISCVKFVFITCDKKVNTVNIFIYVLAVTVLMNKVDVH